MAFQDLKSKLEALSPEASDEPILVNAELVDSSDIIELMTACLKTAELIIEPSKLIFTDTTATIWGTASVLNVEEVEVQAVFLDQNGTLQLQLTANLPDDWTFKQSFPNLAKYLSFDPRKSGYRTSYLYLLEFIKPTLVLTSAPFDENETTFERGLSFAGKLALTGLLAPLGLIVGDPKTSILISGLLSAGDENQEFCLSAVFPLSLGSESLAFENPQLNLYSSFTKESFTETETDSDPKTGPTDPKTEANDDTQLTLEESDQAIADAVAAAAAEPGGEETAAASKVEVVMRLKIANKLVEFFIPFQLGSTPDFIIIAGRFTNFNLPTLGDTASLIGDTDLASSLPASLQEFGGLTIAEAVVGFSIRNKTLNYVSLTINSISAWTVISDVLVMQSLSVNWLVNAPLRSRERQITCMIDAQLEISLAVLNFHAELPRFLVMGQLAPGSIIPVGSLISHFNSTIPNLDDSLIISQLNIFADPRFKSYQIEAQIENVLKINVDFTEATLLEVRSLYLSLNYGAQDLDVQFVGVLALFERSFEVTVLYSKTRQPALPPSQTNPAPKPVVEKNWTLICRSLDRISLPDLVRDVAGVEINEFGLEELAFSDLYLEIGRGHVQSFAFRGAVLWDTGISLTGGESIQVSAALDIRKTGTQWDYRRILGTLQADIPYFENLKLVVIYSFVAAPAGTAPPLNAPPPKPNTQPAAQGTRSLIFQLTIGTFLIEATYNSGPPGTDTILTFTTKTTDGQPMTLGTLLTFLVSLVDPGVDDFELDPPWNELNKISLDGISLIINTTQKTFTASYKPSQPIDLGFMSITSIGLVYHDAIPAQAGKPAQKRSVDIAFTGRFLDKTYGDKNPLAWDTMNAPPPAVPGQGSGIFDLRYLGIGQHVSFSQARVAELTNVTQVIKTLRESMIPPAEPADKNKNPLAIARKLQFNAESGWLIGAQFSVIDTLDLSLIFNDPLLYGIRIGLRGEKAKIFAGLVFEILYRRISDTIGVYHIELVLPDAMRQLEFGAVSVTLPVVVVDIYTNGDFKLDFGFPWQFNFARSFAIDAFPFTGAGGFYFNKLSAETATSVPIITNGRFNPVIEFGIGLKIGLGKTFNKGVLKAELSITVQGIIEGVIAWFNPTSPNLATDQYYRIQGGVAIVGRLWGMVDFEIIQVEVEVIVRAVVLFVVEAYQPILLTLTAEVSVRASVKIVFVRIHFSFNLTITQSFTLGSARPTPWILDPDQSKRRPVTGTGTQVLAAAAAPPFAPPAQSPAAARFAAPQAATFAAPQPTTLDVTAVPVAGAEASQPETSQPETNQPETNQPEASQPEAVAAAPIAPIVSLEARVAAFSFVEIPTPTPLSWQAIAIDIPTLPQTNHRYAIDLFFQPAVTRNHAGIQGIGLLLIENAIDFNSTSAASFAQNAAQNNRDFDTLMQVLLTWAIDAYYVQAGTAHLTSNRTVTPDTYPAIAIIELENLYAMFVQGEQDDAAPFSFEQLLAFLERNFSFSITSFTQQTSGTLFPMLPQLRMQAGATDVTFNSDQFRLDGGDRQAFARYFEQLKGKHGNTVERHSPPPPNGASSTIANSPNSPAVATFIFGDYFSLLLRSTIQSAIEYTTNYLKQHPDQQTIPLATLLQGLNTGGQFNQIAAMASRFLLHGLRLPEWRDSLLANLPGGSIRPTMPLYEGTGQQFPLPATVDTDFRITLSKPDVPPNSSDPLAWISLQTAYPLSDGLVSLIRTLDLEVTRSRIQTGNFPALSPTLLPFYSSQPRRFNLRQSTDWHVQSSTPPSLPLKYTILDLPDDLRGFQTRKYLPIQRANRANPSARQVDSGINLVLQHGTPPTKQGTTPGRTEFDRTELKPEDLHRVTDCFWATQVKVTLRRVPAADGTALLDKTYLLVGTDEEGKDLLEDLWHHLRDSQTANPRLTAKLHLLHAENSKDGDGERVPALSNPIPAENLLLKTNLSTYSSRPIDLDSTRQNSLYSATLDDSTNFIQLLWEGSTVNTGGYYLRLAMDGQENGQTVRQGLPSNLFADGLSAALVLLVELSAAGNQTLPLYHFQNCLVVRRELDLQHSVLYAESTNPADVVRALSIPPGSIGFQQSRSIPIVLDDASGVDELENLYQMLGYRLLETDDFAGSNEGLPIGPTEASVPEKWSYERVMPIYGLAKQRHTPDTPTLPKQLRSLPPAAQDPYAGIDADAQVKLEFHWQDIYGNRLTTNGGTQIAPDVRYFDRLLGINQWSSVAESYQFQPIPTHPSQVELIIELVFDQSPFIPTPGHPFAETQQKTHTARATYEQAYYQIHQPDVTLTVHTSILRDPNQVQQAQTRQLTDRQKKYFTDFVESAYLYLSTLEQLQPQTYTVQAGNTLTDLSTSYYVTVRALAAANAELPQLWTTDQPLALEYAIADSDTLGSIARSLLKVDGVSETQLSQQLPTKLDQIALANADTPGLLQVGADIPLEGGTRYTIQPDDTLTKIAGATQKTVQQIVQAAAEVTDLLEPKADLRVNYTLKNTDSLRSLEQKAQIISPQLNLTLADIAEQQHTVPLRAGLVLVIPERVTIARGLPTTTTIPENATLIAITTDLLADRNKDGELGSFSLADVAIANQNLIGLLHPNIPILASNATPETLNRNSSPNLDANDWQRIINATITTRVNETVYTLANRFTEIVKQQKPNAQVTVADVAAAIADTPNLWVANQTLIVPPASLVYTGNPATTSHLSVQFDRVDGNHTLLYPTNQFIFPVTVQIDMSRNPDFVTSDADLKRDIPEIQQITAFLSPKTTLLSAAVTGTSEQINSLSKFAQDFQAAFPNLYLAIGNETPHKHSTSASDDDLMFQPLWAVHIGLQGIQYDIKESLPFFFTPVPLANSLLAGNAQINTYNTTTGLGTRETKQVEAIDLNVLARDFLAAVEDFLEPTVSVPAALRSKADKVKEILNHKETLADAIHTQVKNILAQTDDADITRRCTIAADALRQQLLVNLVAAFDIETIIQYNVDVTIAGINPKDPNWKQTNPNWTRERAPRLAGQPVVLNLKQINEDGSVTVLDRNQTNSQINFSLAAGKIPLSPEDSYLTFFFDTKSPEKLENLRLELVYRISEMEYDITDVEGISDYQASDWLTFILPIGSTAIDHCDPKTESNCIGDVDIPIPLRTYPMPPSLVLQRAIADQDSLKQLQDIRQWEYQFVYEHLDVAQDAIESRIEYNAVPPTANGASPQASTSTNVSSEQQDLFSSLVNFATVYPQLLPTLKELTNEQTPVSVTVINQAIDDFTTLVGAVAIAWKTWRKTAAQTPISTPVADYTVDEFLTTQSNQIKIRRKETGISFPTVFVPGYELKQAPDPNSLDLEIIYRFRQKLPAEAALDPVFGESSIPDRMFSIPNLDIIQHQNAWASVWLTRNKKLVRQRQSDGRSTNDFMTTNPDFVFQTPAVRFSNLIAPLLVNNQRWNIATIDSADGTLQARTLAAHLEKLFTTLLPQPPSPAHSALKAYDFRVACRYAFALSAGTGISQDLLSTLPVLLSPRFSVTAEQNPQTATANLQTNLVRDIKQWFSDSKPNAANALFVFSVSLFSNPADTTTGDTVNLPLLQIDHLGLRLEQITDL